MTSDPTGDKVLKVHADLMRLKGPGTRADHDAMTVRSDEEDESDVSESDSGSESDGNDEVPRSIDGTSTPHVSESLERPGKKSPRNVGESGKRGEAAAVPGAPKPAANEPSALPDKQPSKMAAAAAATKTEEEEAPMTDAEAARILWPPSLYPDPTSGPAPLPLGSEGLREKFRAGDVCLPNGFEAKTLVVVGQKQLRSDHDRRIGLVKKRDCGGDQGPRLTSP